MIKLFSDMGADIPVEIAKKYKRFTKLRDKMKKLALRT